LGWWNGRRTGDGDRDRDRNGTGTGTGTGPDRDRDRDRDRERNGTGNGTERGRERERERIGLGLDWGWDLLRKFFKLGDFGAWGSQFFPEKGLVLGFPQVFGTTPFKKGGPPLIERFFLGGPHSLIYCAAGENRSSRGRRLYFFYTHPTIFLRGEKTRRRLISEERKQFSFIQQREGGAGVLKYTSSLIILSEVGGRRTTYWVLLLYTEHAGAKRRNLSLSVGGVHKT